VLAEHLGVQDQIDEEVQIVKHETERLRTEVLVLQLALVVVARLVWSGADRHEEGLEEWRVAAASRRMAGSTHQHHCLHAVVPLPVWLALQLVEVEVRRKDQGQLLQCEVDLLHSALRLESSFLRLEGGLHLLRFRGVLAQRPAVPWCCPQEAAFQY